MSKSLKKLIDINRLREFKNKLVGTGSAYVQTTAIDQTVAGTKTFSKPIVGSVTGSSGSCTGNAATATTATTATNATNSNAANQLQAFVNDDFTSGNHYVKAIRSSYGWSTHLWMCYNNGAKMADEVSVNYANSAGSANTANSATTATTAKACTGNAASANIATKATQDAAGNTITTTYATKAENNTKANNSEVVHKSGDETIAGTKTFSNGVLLTNVNAFMAQNGEYTLVLRNDSYNTYLLMSDKGGVPGTWSDARPLTISNSTGVCDINGNASTATKLAAKRTIALSGAATGTATGFDGSGNITIPVTSLDASKLTGTASVSTTGNAATATKAVRADSATNASHATSADKATKAEQDGNGNNIVASYVAAGSEDSTTDIGAFMAARPSFIKSFTYNNVWTDAISMRHRNGSGDGPNYGTYIRSSEMTGVSNLLWNHQYAGKWQGERTLIDSANLAGFILSMVYPVGSVYISVNDVSPEKFLGGTWEKISQGRVLQGASGTQTAGTEVSAGLPNISVSQNGEHTHTRGSMNITGTVTMHGIGNCTVINRVAGAFYGSGTESSYQETYCASGAPSERLINFSADRTWTGSTSSDGAHSHNAYITGITGNSTTVQPPALLVNIWKRTA